MPQLARLLDDHANLIAISESLLAIVAQPIAQPDEAMDALARLSAALDDHLAVEDEMLAHARAAGTRAFMPLAVQRGEVFCHLVKDWVAYLRAWPDAKARGNWPGFVRDTLDIVRRLIQQIEVENEAVRIVARRQHRMRDAG